MHKFGHKVTTFFAYIKKKVYLCSRFMTIQCLMAKKRFGIIVLLASLSIVSLMADNTTPPAYQIADNTFFDPTRKVEREKSYAFHVEYRIEAGYAQDLQYVRDLSFPSPHLYGARIGASFTFVLPLNFGLQTGLHYAILGSKYDQHWRSMTVANTQTEIITHHLLAHNLIIPLRAYYTVPVWKDLNLFFFTGPQLQIGLAQRDNLETYLSEETKTWLEAKGIHTSPYDRMTDELVRANIQWGVGGGLEWDRYRLQAGYDFGLNNLVKHKQTANQYMSQWGMLISFCYRF